MKIVYGDIIYVRWLDSAAPHQWTHEDQLHDEPLICESIGWFIREGKETLTVGGHRTSEGQWDGIMSIPTAAVTKVHKLPAVKLGKK